MKKIKTIAILILVTSTMYFFISSCSKEYSCENCFVGNPIIPVDTTKIIDSTEIDSTIKFSSCIYCDSTRPLHPNSWAFKNYNSYVCGDIDTAYFSPPKNSFIFWGKLQCSPYTIFQLETIYSNEIFNSNKYNISTTLAVLYVQDQSNYLDPWNGRVLFAEGPPLSNLRVVVDTFLNSSKLMVGRFYGYVGSRNKKSYIDGKFKFIIH